MRRELSLYFTAMSAAESVRLVASSVAVLLAGNAGPATQAARFETAWRHRFGGDDAVVFPSGRAGLYSLLQALGVGPGDEVILTGYTCEAVAVSVLHGGAVPVYADIDPLSYSIDPSGVEGLITPKTKVLVIQHTYGIPAPVEQLVALARERGLYVIEDACLAMGSQINRRPLGSFADAALFSFEVSKTISAGWGGLVQTNTPDLGNAVRAARSTAKPLGRLGVARRLLQAGLSGLLYRPSVMPIAKYLIWGFFRVKIFKYSASPQEATGHLAPSALSGMDAHWSVLVSQLARLDQVLERSRHIAERYQAVLLEHDWPTPMPVPDESIRLIRFPLVVHDALGMLAYFATEGIELGRWFDYPIAPPHAFAPFGYAEGSCPVAEEIGHHIVNLPLHSRLSEADVTNICSLLDQYLGEHPNAASIASRLVSHAAL